MCNIIYRINEIQGRKVAYMEYNRGRNDLGHKVGDVILIHDRGDGDLDQLNW